MRSRLTIIRFEKKPGAVPVQGEHVEYVSEVAKYEVKTIRKQKDEQLEKGPAQGVNVECFKERFWAIEAALSMKGTGKGNSFDERL